MEDLLETLKKMSVEEQDSIIANIYGSRHKKKTVVKSEKRNAWSAEVSRVWEELKKTDPAVKRSAAMVEASRRRKATVSNDTVVVLEGDESSEDLSVYSAHESPLTADEIKTRDIFKYYLSVQKTGSSNLLNIENDRYFLARFGLNRVSAHDAIMNIVNNYDTFLKKYGNSS